MNNDMLRQLKDIKPPVEVPDHSIWVFFALMTLFVLVIAALLYLLRRKRGRKRGRRRIDPIEIARRELRSIDFNDTKRAVYTFDEYLPLLLDDDESKHAFEALQRDLERYKYRKDVPPLDSYDRRRMEKLIKKALS